MTRSSILAVALALMSAQTQAATVTTTLTLDPVAAKSFVDQGGDYQLSDYSPTAIAVGYANDARVFPGLPDHSGLYVGVMEFSVLDVPPFATTPTTIVSAYIQMRWPGGVPALHLTDYFGDGVVAASDTNWGFIAHVTPAVPDTLVFDVTERFRAFHTIGLNWYGVFVQDASPDFGCTQGTLCLSNIAGLEPPTATDPLGRQPELVITYSQTFPDPPPSVPEPGVWALLGVGFGLLGAGLRQRRPLTV